jgi:NADP-dependent 3-hydroxy acid dehydrogenase YdfG
LDKDFLDMHESDAPVWLVTGGATGFGREIISYALGQGHRVVATARDVTRLVDVAEAHPGRALLMPLDVTDPHQVTRAVKAAEDTFDRVDVLVNNAGYGFVAAVEEARDAEIRQLMETHVFGTIATIKAVLPGMRQRRRGHIINFSSIAGMIGSAGTAYYAAAKFAVEGLSEGLSKEVAPLGINVTIIEPGPFQTNFFTTSRRMGEVIIPDYDATAGAYRRRAAKADPWLPGDPARAAKIIYDMALSDQAPLRLLLGKFAVDVVTAKLQSHLEEIARWRDVSLSADKPDAAGREWP